MCKKKKGKVHFPNSAGWAPNKQFCFSKSPPFRILSPHSKLWFHITCREGNFSIPGIFLRTIQRLGYYKRQFCKVVNVNENIKILKCFESNKKMTKTFKPHSFRTFAKTSLRELHVDRSWVAIHNYSLEHEWENIEYTSTMKST